MRTILKTEEHPVIRQISNDMEQLTEKTKKEYDVLSKEFTDKINQIQEKALSSNNPMDKMMGIMEALSAREQVDKQREALMEKAKIDAKMKWDEITQYLKEKNLYVEIEGESLGFNDDRTELVSQTFEEAMMSMYEIFKKHKNGENNDELDSIPMVGKYGIDTDTDVDPVGGNGTLH